MPGERLKFTNSARFLAFLSYLAKGVPNLQIWENLKMFWRKYFEFILAAGVLMYSDLCLLKFKNLSGNIFERICELCKFLRARLGT